jgi:hypothetical protein
MHPHPRPQSLTIFDRMQDLVDGETQIQTNDRRIRDLERRIDAERVALRRLDLALPIPFPPPLQTQAREPTGSNWNWGRWILNLWGRRLGISTRAGLGGSIAVLMMGFMLGKRSGRRVLI